MGGLVTPSTGSASPPPAIAPSNSTETPLVGGATFTGAWVSIVAFASISVIAVADQAATLWADFSTDGVTAARNVQLSDGTSGAMGIHSLTPVAAYFRVRVVNGATPQTSLSVQTLFNTSSRIAFPTSRLGQTIGLFTDVINVRSVVVGKQDSGAFVSVPVTQEGHLEVALHDPRTAFGEVRIAELSPRVQAAFTYGANPEHWTTWTTSGGTVTTSGGLCTVAIDATANARARLTTRERLHYRAGQGAIARFTGVFPAGAANSEMYLGPITAESGWAFGRNGTAYGVLYRTGGQRSIKTLTVTVGAGGGENATVTLEGVAKVVALVSGNTISTAYQLSRADYSTTGSGWDAEQRGATVTFVCRLAKVVAGAFTLTSAGTAAGTIANTTTGVAPTDTWTPQADWDDPMLADEGATGVVLDPTKGQVYELSYQYLGFGPVFYKVEYHPDDENNPSYAYVKTLRYLNQNTVPSVAVPSAPLTCEVVSLGSTTPLSVSLSSVMLGTEGRSSSPIPMPTITASSSVVGATELPLVSIRNSLAFNGTKTNQTGKKITKLEVAVRGATNAIVTVRIRRDATLTGTPNFAAAATGISCADVSTTATGVSGGTIVYTKVFVETAQISDTIEEGQLLLEPGENYTISAQASTGATNVVAVSVDSGEYQ